MSEKHYPYIGGSFDRIIFDGDGSVWVPEPENAKLREKCDGLTRLANIDAMMIFLSRDCSFKDCKECDVNPLCDEAVYLQGLYGIDKDLARIEVEA